MSNLTIIIAALAFAIFLVLAVSIVALGASFGRASAALRPPIEFPILSLSDRVAQRVPFEPYEFDECEGALTPEEETWFASTDSSHTISDSKTKIPAIPNVTPVKPQGSFNCTLFDDDARLRRSTMRSTISTVNPLLDLICSDEAKELVSPTYTLPDDDARPYRSIVASSIQPTVSRQAPVKMDAEIASNLNRHQTKTQKDTRAFTTLIPDIPTIISTVTPTCGAPNVTNMVKPKRVVHYTIPRTTVGAHKPVQQLMHNNPRFNPKPTKETSPPALPLPLPGLGDMKNIIADDIEAQIPTSPCSSSQRSFLNISGNRFSSLTHALSQKARGAALASNDIKFIIAQKSRACRSSLVDRLDRVSSPQVLPLVNPPDQQTGGSLRGWLRTKAVSAFASSMGLEEDDSESFKFKLDEQDKYFLMDYKDDSEDLEAGDRTLHDDLRVVDYARMSHEEFCSVFLEGEE